MFNDYHQKLRQMEMQLQRLSQSKYSAIELCTQVLTLLLPLNDIFDERVRNHQFLCNEDEIQWFRNQKPLLSSKIIYYIKLYSLELEKPIGSKALKKHYNKQLDKIAAFFTYNATFIAYLRSGDRHLDHRYFVRSTPQMGFIPETFHLGLDRSITTGYDLKVAKLIAYEQLTVFIEQALQGLSVPVFADKTATPILHAPPTSALPVRWLKSHQVERLLGVSRSTLQKMRRNGSVPFTKIEGILYYNEAELLQVLEDNKRKGLFGD